MVLYKAPEVDIRAVLFAECRNLLLIVLRKAFPLGEVRSTVLVAEHTECGIWKKPAAVGLHELLILLCSGKLLESLCVSLAEKLTLDVVHTFVIYLLKSVELCLKSLVLLIHLNSDCREMEELRMECEGRVRVVWI